MKLLILEDDPVVVGALESALIPRWLACTFRALAIASSTLRTIKLAIADDVNERIDLLK